MKALHTTLLIGVLVIFVSSKNIRQDALLELEEYIEKARLEVNQRYRLQYHVAAPVGWINDPNGFSYYKGQYHLFYQYYPYEAKWGPMHWGHVTSKDLVNWERQPTALLPEEEQCFSGSAVVYGDRLVLMYTGHVITEVEPFYNQSQYLAFSTDGVYFEKYDGNPVLPVAPNASPDFRDPKVWKYEDHWYVVLGSKVEERGRVLLYRSRDLITWEFLTVLAESDGDLGFMWECPDFFELNGKYILLMSPQGVEPQGDRYNNIYQTGYIVGKFDYESFEFIPETSFQELDYGHDFYAAQTTEANGTRLLVGWLGMWEVPYPEDDDGWTCALTLIRQLRLDNNNRIIMSPVEEQTSLRHEEIYDDNLSVGQELQLGAAVELLIENDFEKNVDLLLEGNGGGGRVFLHWDSGSGKVVLDREGDIRQVEWTSSGNKPWRIFLDTSSLELFCGEGEVVFTSRVYPVDGWKLTNSGEQDVKLIAFALKRSVPV